MTRTLSTEEIDPNPEDGWVYAHTLEFTERSDGRSDGLNGYVEHIDEVFHEIGIGPGDTLQAYVLATDGGETVAFERRAYKTSCSFSVAEKHRRELNVEAGDKAHVWIRAPPKDERTETREMTLTEATRAAGDGGSVARRSTESRIEHARAVTHATDELIEAVERIESRYDDEIAERAVKLFAVNYLRGEQ